MPKQIVADTFETLGQTVKQIGQQVAGEPQKMTEAAGKQISDGGQPPPEEKVASAQAVSPVQKALNKRATQTRLDYLQQELSVLRQRKTQKQEAVKTQKEQQKQVITQLEIQKKKEEPLVVSLARQKTGTGERRIKGVSG